MLLLASKLPISARSAAKETHRAKYDFQLPSINNVNFSALPPQTCFCQSTRSNFYFLLLPTPALPFSPHAEQEHERRKEAYRARAGATLTLRTNLHETADSTRGRDIYDNGKKKAAAAAMNSSGKKKKKKAADAADDDDAAPAAAAYTETLKIIC